MLLIRLCSPQQQDAAAVPALVADFRQLRATFMRDGLFKSSKAYYLWKMASTFALLAGSVTVLLWAARESMLALVRRRASRNPDVALHMQQLRRSRAVPQLSKAHGTCDDVADIIL